jgi:hypothetical protein
MDKELKTDWDKIEQDFLLGLGVPREFVEPIFTEMMEELKAIELNYRKRNTKKANSD